MVGGSLLPQMACSVTQLSYHPAFDAYHQIYRTIRLLLGVGEAFNAHKLRMADFYLLFPEKISDIRLSTELRALARRLNKEPRYPYDNMPESRLLFARMEPTFQAALQTMIHERLVDQEEATHDLLRLGSGVPRDSSLVARALEANSSESELVNFLSKLIRSFDYTGPNGLKARTALEEHRYDAV